MATNMKTTTTTKKLSPIPRAVLSFELELCVSGKSESAASETVKSVMFSTLLLVGVNKYGYS